MHTCRFPSKKQYIYDTVLQWFHARNARFQSVLPANPVAVRARKGI